MGPFTLVLLASSLPFVTPFRTLGKHGHEDDLEKRDGVCSSGIYGELGPVLQQYPIAVSFCQAAYPVKCGPQKRAPAAAVTTTTSTKSATTMATKTSSSVTTKAAAAATTKSSSTTTSNKSSTTTADAKASAMSKLKTQAASIISTLCSCIEPSKTCTTSSISTSTTAKLTTTSATTSSSTTTPSTTSSSTTSSSTSTTSSTTTSSTTTSSTTTSTSARPTGNVACQATAFPTPIGAVDGYTQQFVGNGVQTNPATDSGNTQPAAFPPYTDNIPFNEPTDDFPGDCQAISKCASLAASRPNQYYSFDLHFDTSIQQYVCVQYYDPGQTASDFTVVNPAVGNAYGYTAV